VGFSDGITISAKKEPMPVYQRVSFVGLFDAIQMMTVSE
jgi:hypothetical protein